MHAKYDYVSLLVQNSMMKSQKSLKNEIPEMSKPIIIHKDSNSVKKHR